MDNTYFYYKFEKLMIGISVRYCLKKIKFLIGGLALFNLCGDVVFNNGIAHAMDGAATANGELVELDQTQYGRCVLMIFSQNY